ncbi:putative Ig domain-containing protein [Catellatospora tritici]|uniref:putative Ig domain-containing protein n=1 Tax=Catellatospora tritici TaxID=2851566 RepID=UPI001C2DECAB|nr:putative Ig domain-containing protein [Catellatospora tritici]MBV1854339.1 putative Ig domain-containing protein [Catellatospora tritici]
MALNALAWSGSRARVSLVAVMAAVLALVVGIASPAAATTSGWVAPDAGFAANLGAAFNGSVRVLAVQPDGKILAGGDYTAFDGVTANRLVRLNPDGTRDTAFSTAIGTGFEGPTVGVVSAIAVQPDGKILVGGNFTTFDGVTANRLVRLNPDGTRDTAFSTALGTGFNTSVLSLAVQPDGKIVAGGLYTTLNGVTVNRLVRLNPDGTREVAFSTALGTGFNNSVPSIALQADGKILAAGTFTTLNGVTVNRLVRLNPDGTRDTAFSTALGTGFDANVLSVTVQPDGGIIACGGFTTLNGSAANHLVGLNPDGTRDTAFNTNLGTGPAGGTPTAVVAQPDGKVLVSGSFITFNGADVRSLIRLNADGTADTAFNTGLGTGTTFSVFAVAVQPDGNVLAGGAFTVFNGVAANRLIRVAFVTVSVSPIPDQTDAVGDVVSVPVVATSTGGPIAYSATGLPAGLSIDPGTGVISGAPTTAATTTVTVTATSSTITDQATFTWTITPAPTPPVITSGPPVDGTVGAPYHFTITASGFPAPTFSVTAGKLPKGLSLDTSTGVISGTPKKAKTYTFTVTATNSAGSDAQTYTIRITKNCPYVSGGHGHCPKPLTGPADTGGTSGQEPLA